MPALPQWEYVRVGKGEAEGEVLFLPVWGCCPAHTLGSSESIPVCALVVSGLPWRSPHPDQDLADIWEHLTPSRALSNVLHSSHFHKIDRNPFIIRNWRLSGLSSPIQKLAQLGVKSWSSAFSSTTPEPTHLDAGLWLGNSLSQLGHMDVPALPSDVISPISTNRTKAPPEEVLPHGP